MKQHAVMGGPQPAVLQEVSCGPGQFKLAWFAGPGSGGLSVNAHTRRAIKIVPRHTRPAIVHAHLEVNCSQYALKLRFLHHPRLSSVGVPTPQVTA